MNMDEMIEMEKRNNRFNDMISNIYVMILIQIVVATIVFVVINKTIGIAWLIGILIAIFGLTLITEGKLRKNTEHLNTNDDLN